MKIMIKTTTMLPRHNGVIFDSSNCQLHGEFTFPPSFTQPGVTNIFEVIMMITMIVMIMMLMMRMSMYSAV